ncbi:hypothetical protein GIB67_040000 [Kingdonia uniflora]|uniref:Uncharacterized protein n=1 Tax=Kingdonia uniflora TaxID=39325 RepID=A0A7J7LI26_9MAGN|nr:hypothetical protein GIB67_040000 [Kingdonia uniflora]
MEEEEEKEELVKLVISLQKALQKEVNYFRHMGTEESIITTSLSHQLKPNPGDSDQSSSSGSPDDVELQIVMLNHKISVLQCKLDEQSIIHSWEQKRSVVGEQNQLLHKLKDGQCKALWLKNHAQESCQKLISNEKVLNMQNRVCKHILCLFIQLLGIILYLCCLPKSLSFRYVPT